MPEVPHYTSNKNDLDFTGGADFKVGGGVGQEEDQKDKQSIPDFT